MDASPAEAAATISADDSVTPAPAPSHPRSKEVESKPASKNPLISQSSSQANVSELKPGGAGPRAAEVSERPREADMQVVDSPLRRPTPEVGNIQEEATPRKGAQAARMSSPEPGSVPTPASSASLRAAIESGGGHALEEELEESRAELQKAHAERARLEVPRA